MSKAAAAHLIAMCCLVGGCTTMAQPASKTGVSPESPAELALAVVAEKLSVDPDELELIRIEPKQWSDSSIGCPRPGMNYLQVVTPGHFALVRDAQGVTYRVHMAKGAGAVCERKSLAADYKLQPMPVFSRNQLEALARADLAQRLGVPAAEISSIATRSVEWPDASLGCAVGEEMATGGATKGFVMTLAHAGRRYSYHTDLHQAIPCPPIESR